MEWSVITVSFNSARLFDCDRWSKVVSSEREWLVVDNHSADSSADAAERLGAITIRLPKNVGFSTANNVALVRATGKRVLFCNPDVHPHDLDFAALSAAVDATGGLVGPRLLNSDGSNQMNGRGLPFLVDKFAHRGVTLPGASVSQYLPSVAPVEYQRVPWIVGAAVAGSKGVFEQLNGWDERFFLYYEDHDLSLRAWRLGFPVTVANSVTCRHDWERATTKLRWSPWRREFSSAARFYARYPALLWATRDRRVTIANAYRVPTPERPFS